MNKFQPYINVAYPKGNQPIFEEWFWNNYKGCNTEREPIPVFFTSYWVNNNYAQDLQAKQELQDFVDNLDRSKKWFTLPVQYDDGVVVDLKDLDVLQLNMSKQNGIMLPLICQPHPYKFSVGKKWFASFVGSRTHPIRDKIEYLKNTNGFYISFEPHFIQDYCRVLDESMFALCPRGYGRNSFRIAEAIQYGAVPVYISDEFILPFNIDFNDFGVLIKEDDIPRIDEILQSVPPESVIQKQNKLKEVYEKYYSFEGCMKQIIYCLEKENAPTS